MPELVARSLNSEKVYQAGMEIHLLGYSLNGLSRWQ
jgi:hypothetical protein